MEHILHRLTMAAADADMRHKMNVEDEYFSAIEKRDTEILMKQRELAEISAQLSEQEEMLRKTVKMLQDAGMTIEDVAKSLGKDLETIQSFI